MRCSAGIKAWTSERSKRKEREIRVPMGSPGSQLRIHVRRRARPTPTHGAGLVPTCRLRANPGHTRDSSNNALSVPSPIQTSFSLPVQMVDLGPEDRCPSRFGTMRAWEFGQ